MENLEILLPNAAQLETVTDLLSIIAANIGSTAGASSWKSISQMVKTGIGERAFPVGYEATVENSDTGITLECRVLDHDKYIAANKSIKHTMAMGLKFTYKTSAGNSTVRFSEPQALYYAKDGLDAGTYNFTLPAGYDVAHGGGSTYSFTLSQSLPTGGIIVFPWSTSSQAKSVKISTYKDNAATAPIENGIVVTESADGTSLGTADGSTENMNHIYRCRIGSNNYAQGAIHQMLNSVAEAGQFWTPQTKFDRAPAWVNTMNGFMHGLPADFLSAVQPVIVPCRTNSTYETDNLDGTDFQPNQAYNVTARFFIPSRGEIFGTYTNATLKDGEQLEYFKGLDATERIMRDADGTARGVWLRTPYASDCSTVETMTLEGKTGNNGAYLTNSIYVLFVIG